MSSSLLSPSSDSCTFLMSSSILDDPLLSVDVSPLPLPLVSGISHSPPHQLDEATAAVLSHRRPADDGGLPDPLPIHPEQQQQQHQQLNTPTMHPKLVSTLKSIICPAFSPCDTDQILVQPPQDVSLDLAFANSVCSSRCSNVDFQSIYGPADPSPSTIVPEKREQISEQKQAAIVPIHMIQNRRPYKCNFNGCNKTFKNPQTLKMHRKTHCSSGSSDERRDYNGKMMHSLATVPPSSKAGQNKKIPSRCPVCKRAFVGLYELRRHFGRKHSEGEKTHVCNKCSKRFYIEVDLRDHQKLCGEPLVCKCGMKFAFKCNLVAHKKTHPSCQDDQDSHPPQSSDRQSTSTSQQQKTAKHQNQQQQSSATPVSSLPTPVFPRTFFPVNSTDASLASASNRFPPNVGQFLHPSMKSEQYFQCNIWPCVSSTVSGIGRAL